MAGVRSLIWSLQSLLVRRRWDASAADGSVQIRNRTSRRAKHRSAWLEAIEGGYRFSGLKVRTPAFVLEQTQPGRPEPLDSSRRCSPEKNRTLKVSRVSNIAEDSGILSMRRDRYEIAPMPARRLEDRIRELCARALFEREPEWRGTIHELQLAIHEHALRVSNAATGTVVSGQRLIRERRESAIVGTPHPGD